MTLKLLPIIMNVTLCSLIIARVLIFRKGQCRYKMGFSLLAWLLTVSCGIVIISLLSGHYQLADWAEIVINFVFCICIHLGKVRTSS